jgi:hypothetical protein
MNSIAHYGVPGMKWGRRKTTPSSDHSDTRVLMKKKRKELSNKELEAVAKRLRLETEVAKLTKSPGSRAVRKGSEVVGKLLGNYGTQTAAVVTAAAAAATGKFIVEYAKKYAG